MTVVPGPSHTGPVASQHMDVHIPPRCLAGVHLYRVVVDWWGWMGLPAIFRSFPGPFFVSAPAFTGMGRKDEFQGPDRLEISAKVPYLPFRGLGRIEGELPDDRLTDPQCHNNHHKR